MTGDPAGPDIGADGLAELVLYYAHALAVAPSAAVYDELLSARSFAGDAAGPVRAPPAAGPDGHGGVAVQPAGDIGGRPRQPRGGGHLVYRYRTTWPGRRLPGTARLGGADPVTNRLVLGRPAGIDTAYRPQARAPWDQPTNYARTLLILALATAELGDLDQAVTAGTAALDCGRIVWPTMVLAGKLDQALARRFPGATAATDYRARYLDAGTRLPLPAPRPQPGKDRG
jgi:hypothetical protein